MKSKQRILENESCRVCFLNVLVPLMRRADVPALEESKMLVSCGAEGSVAVTLRSFSVWFRILDVTPTKLLRLKAHAAHAPVPDV